MARRWFRGLCALRLQDVEGEGNESGDSHENDQSNSHEILTQHSAASAVGGSQGSLTRSSGGSARNKKRSLENVLRRSIELSQSQKELNISIDCDDESLDPNEFIPASKSSPDSKSDNASLEGSEVFEIHSPMPRPKKQFLEAALTAKSLSDLNYVHATDPSDAAKWKSMTDLKYDDDDESLGDTDLFELDESIPTKKQFLDAALTAKSQSDLNFYELPPKEVPASHSSSGSIGEVEIFDLDESIPTKKQFLEAALTAKSQSDLNFHALPPKDASGSHSSSGSIGEVEIFDLDESIPTKKQFLEAALTAKSQSDLNFHALPPKDASGSHSSSGSIGDDLFVLDESIPTKKQFLDAALTAKSQSDLNFHALPAKDASASQSSSGSIGDDLFDLDESIPTKKQFLDAALTAKSQSDLNFHALPAKDGSASQSSSGSIGDDLFDLDESIPTKNQFLDAALTAKSLSDLNYVHTTEPSDASKWKSMTDLKYDEDDESLGDNDLFELDESIPTKKQFLDAALTAKSQSDLNFYAVATQGESVDNDPNGSSDSLEVEIFNLESPIARPKKKFLEAAFMAKSLSDLNYVHSEEVRMPRRKSMTDLKYADEESLGDNELFEFDEPVPAKKKFLDAALTAKSISDLNFVYSAQEQGGAISQSSNDSNGSLGSTEVFGIGSPVVPRKKKFLDAAFMAKSLSDLNYLHSTEVQMPRRKSMTDLNYDDDRSLGDNELFELDSPVVKPKKQFLEAALMAKSMSDLKFMYLNTTTYSSSKDSESRDDTSNIVPEHLLHLSQPNLFHSSDIHSIDGDALFESMSEDQPTERPILKAALEAKAQQQEGVVVIDNRGTQRPFTDDQMTEIVPEHLVIANQPATVHSHDNYSIDAEDIFDHPSGEQKTRKPLLKAALEAQAQREDKELAKTLSQIGAVNLVVESSSAHGGLPKNVPDHLAIVNQPTNTLPTLDELSIDGDRLFDSPAPKGRNSLLQAALRAKKDARSLEPPISKRELRMLSLNDPKG